MAESSLNRQKTLWEKEKLLEKTPFNQHSFLTLPNDKFLDWSILKAFAGNEINVN